MSMNKWENIQVLIVEDTQSNYLLLEQYLKSTKLQLFHVKNGSDAIQFVEQNINLSLILMDIKLPILNGIDASIGIRKLNSKIPIIAQTAYYQENEQSVLLNAGINELISKPIDKENLIRVISKYLI